MNTAESPLDTCVLRFNCSTVLEQRVPHTGALTREEELVTLVVTGAGAKAGAKRELELRSRALLTKNKHCSPKIMPTHL